MTHGKRNWKSPTLEILTAGSTFGGTNPSVTEGGMVHIQNNGNFMVKSCTVTPTRTMAMGAMTQYLTTLFPGCQVTAGDLGISPTS